MSKYTTTAVLYNHFLQL